MENLTLISQTEKTELTIDALIEKTTAAKLAGATKVVTSHEGIISFIKEKTAEEVKLEKIAALEAELVELRK